MIAGFMSGMAGNVSAFATVWTYDVYRTLINRGASDAHYLNMGRWCSILGVLMSIGTAYALFYFSNILEFLQVLIFFFIVPLFGVVIVGMLWKRATPAGAFLGFLTAIILSISMWVYVHTFPDGFRPQPKAVLDSGAVVHVEKSSGSRGATISRVIVEKGTVRTTNVPMPPSIPVTGSSPTLTIEKELELPASVEARGRLAAVRLLAPDVVQAATKQPDRFGVEAVPVVLRPGVKVESLDVEQTFNPAEFNPAHTKYIARSEMAKPMAVNMYSAFWTLLVCVTVLVGVSFFTTPKPDGQLHNLVMGLTIIPDDGPSPWYQSPHLWAGVVGVVLVAINIIFW
jgi:hypothetical protein